MPCCLTLSATGKERFLAKPGCKITISLKGPSGVNAEILHIQYAGDPIDDTNLEPLVVAYDLTRDTFPPDARKTVDTHLNRINRKLGLRNTAELVRLAASLGMLSSLRAPHTAM